MSAAGLLLLSLAAGSPDWHYGQKQTVAVMVDLSPSTRVADYRDPTVLNRRIRELLGDVPYHTMYFAERASDAAPPGSHLTDMPADHTVYDSPLAPAILLFSDCRFDLPVQSAPTYIVIDPGLEDVSDAAVTKLELNGADASISLSNASGTRQLSLTGALNAGPTTVPAGQYVVSSPRDQKASRISAELSAGDAWPENDSLSLIAPPPVQFERWWIGQGAPSNEWHKMNPEQLPSDAVSYLSAALIVLDNISAVQLSEFQQQRLAQYVRDLGGGLLILGGDHAFAAGAYEGTALDKLSPLACDPPEPTTHWVLLADSSGSMSAPLSGGSTRWSVAVASLASLLPYLAPGDLVSAGNFSDQTTWWIESKPANEAVMKMLPPPGVFPHGPTNLEPALRAIADSADGHMPVQVLLISDFEARISDAGGLVKALRSKRVRLHALAIGDGSSLPMIRQMSAATGGATVFQLDPSRWTESARQLMRAAAVSRIQHDSVQVAFDGDASAAPTQSAEMWNRLWIKNGAIRLARIVQRDQQIPMSAIWNVGEGRCSATAFTPHSEQLRVLSALTERPPHDPRFSVTCDADRKLHLVVDAINGGCFLNDQSLSLETEDLSVSAARANSMVIPQTGPGRYEVTLPAPQSPTVAKIHAVGKIIWQGGIAGRYAPEFDALGNDHAAMNELAARSGGRVVMPDDTTPLKIRWPEAAWPLASWLAIAGAVCIALGLAWWRIN